MTRHWISFDVDLLAFSNDSCHDSWLSVQSRRVYVFVIKISRRNTVCLRVVNWIYRDTLQRNVNTRLLYPDNSGNRMGKLLSCILVKEVTEYYDCKLPSFANVAEWRGNITWWICNCSTALIDPSGMSYVCSAHFPCIWLYNLYNELQK